MSFTMLLACVLWRPRCFSFSILSDTMCSWDPRQETALTIHLVVEDEKVNVVARPLLHLQRVR